MKRIIFSLYGAMLLLALSCLQHANAQFVHPGGLHTRADLDRMKAKVLANEQPWIDGWNLMCADTKAQYTYNASPSATVGGGSDGTRQQAARDAVAAYYNTLRWYVTGDVRYADCAVRILNAWSGSVNAVVTGELFQLPIMPMVQAGEILRIYPGWVAADFTRFKSMCLNYFYPACKNFKGACATWPGWDGPANLDILSIAILCDDQAKFDEALDYYKNGAGGGNIMNTICQASGQISEMGRDQPHAEIGPGSAAQLCQCAWNQGIDLFSYSNNRLLAGFEYLAKFNLNHSVNWVPYNDCNNHNFYYPAINGNGFISHSPDWEIIYNHYVERKGLSAPYTRSMINLRGLIAQTWNDAYTGVYGLTYTLSDTTTLFNLKPIPAIPTNLTANPGCYNIVLKWVETGIDVANGYNILRSTTSGGPYTTIVATNTTNNATVTEYTDFNVTNGTTYYYKVSARNQSGTSANSTEVSATPVAAGALSPSGFSIKDIGTVATAGVGFYANVRNKTFVIKGSGTGMGGTEDSHNYVYRAIKGDFTIVTRLFNTTLSGSNADRVGVMMRETLDAGARMVALGLNDAGFRNVYLTTRSTASTSASWQAGDSHTWTPVWFKLQRSGNTFTGYQSSNGVTWFKVGTSNVLMSSSYYVGYYVCAGTSSGNTTVVFDNDTTAFLSANLTNTQLKVTNLSCRGSNDGRIDISVPQNVAYTVNVTASTAANSVYHFTNNIYSIANLPADTYKVCISQDGISSSNQCFTIVVTQPQELSVVSSLVKSSNKVLLAMAGGDNYNVTLNNDTLKTTDSDIELTLQSGVNRLKVTTDKICQGEYEKTIYLVDNAEVKIHPNPTTGSLIIEVPGNDDQVRIDVFNLSGGLVLSKPISVPSNRLVSIDIFNLSTGEYIIKLSGNEILESARITKIK